MTEEPTPVILPPAEAKKRFALYLALKFAGLACLFGGAFLGRGGATAVPILLLVLGAAALLVRPKHLGLTAR